MDYYIQSDEQDELMYMQAEYYEFKSSYRRVLANIDILSTEEQLELLKALIITLKPGDFL